MSIRSGIFVYHVYAVERVAFGGAKHCASGSDNRAAHWVRAATEDAQ
jgi:hypothetical protein